MYSVLQVIIGIVYMQVGSWYTTEENNNHHSFIPFQFKKTFHLFFWHDQ